MTAFPRCPECNGQRVPMNYVGDVVGAVCMCPVSKSTLYGPWNAFDMDNWSEFTKMLVAERDRLRAALEDLTADRDSWIEQASARTADAVQFMQERDAARAEIEALRADAERLDCGQIMIDTFDEFGEPKQVWHTGMNLRAAIDAAIKAGLK